ncbi:hypothetical protein N7457_008533 [Penicillium paradoxum]|uniref:uncharacterized protein n=1 Tax=Penicillium paradoxum TaxID=176176 RepID=UPI0025486D6A|nr:uncharacterized protein N7457_008533 [Penicillium paradoxum]KAJ5773637.1 hypothetical protein N7457_008533 [Penicillium paradoxum]
MSIGQPQAWKAQDVESDRSYILRLTPEEVEGFQTALAYTKKYPNPLLDMTQADYPVPDSSKKALETAIAAT